MKRFIFLLGALITTMGNAQITITEIDMPVANDTVRISSTIDLWSVDFQSAGPNTLWDFSFLFPGTQRVDTFFTVSSTPFAYQFFFNNQILYPAHKADFAMRGTEFDLFGTLTLSEVFDYFKVEPTYYANVGFGANINGIPTSTRNNPVDTVYEFPLNFNDTYSNSSEWLTNVPGIAAYGQSLERTANVEGWGTLITPFGTFNTLKVKMDIAIRDTLSIDSLGINFGFPRPVATEYHWLANGMSVPVLKINTTGGFVTSIEYQDSIRTSFLNTNEIYETPFIIYPNPASDWIGVKSKTDKLINSITIFDLNGKVVFFKSNLNEKNYPVEIREIPAGIYFMSIDINGELCSTKIVVQH